MTRRGLVSAGIVLATSLLTIILLAAGGQKLLGTQEMITVFDQIGIGQWFRWFTGLWEVTAAALLMDERSRLAGIAMAGALCVGALVAHSVIGGSFVPAFMLLAITSLIAWSDRYVGELPLKTAGVRNA
ncbi:MAG: DoxX family protein [Pseudomonadota bacterium]